jgi:acetyl-CoA C-acetyltransferase
MNLGRRPSHRRRGHRHPEQNLAGIAPTDNRPGTPVPIRASRPARASEKPNPEGVRGSTRVAPLASTRLPDSPCTPACPETFSPRPVRTPIGSSAAVSRRPVRGRAGAAAARETLKRSGLPPGEVGYAVFGNARQAGGGPNPARQIVRRAGLPDASPAFTVNMACASGLQAIVSAAQIVRDGEADIVLAGGAESMSRVPYLLDRARWGYRLGDAEVVDGMYRDGFLCPLCDRLMGETAETLAERDGITREEQDAYAAESQRRCEERARAGRFADEIVLIVAAGPRCAAHGRCRRASAGSGSRRRRSRSFPRSSGEGGTVHAGNSSGITDGAASVLVPLRAGRAPERVEPWRASPATRRRESIPRSWGSAPCPRSGSSRSAGIRLGAIDLVVS